MEGYYVSGIDEYHGEYSGSVGVVERLNLDTLVVEVWLNGVRQPDSQLSREDALLRFSSQLNEKQKLLKL